VGGWGRGSIDGIGGHADGGNIGGTLGCNIQTNGWVWGVEGDALWSGVKDGDAAFLQVKNDFLGSVRARLGVASPTTLLYATGGLGVGRGSISVLGSEASNTHYGWTLGGGLEWMISPNWTAKIEYLHYDFGKETYGSLLDVGFNVDTVRVGLNYKFGL
jgi:outer membrane immunogenic protein